MNRAGARARGRRFAHGIVTPEDCVFAVTTVARNRPRGAESVESGAGKTTIGARRIDPQPELPFVFQRLASALLATTLGLFASSALAADYGTPDTSAVAVANNADLIIELGAGVSTQPA